MTNLYHYITSGEFFSHLPVDKTITIVTDLPLESHMKHVRIVSFWDIISGDITIVSDQIIGISDKYNTHDIMIITKMIGQEINWINLNPGIKSMIHKHHPEDNEIITMQSAGYHIHEPYHPQQIINLMQWTQQYFRIFDAPLPSQLDALSREEGIAFLQGPDQFSHITVLWSVGVTDLLASIVHHINTWESPVSQYIISSRWQTLPDGLIREVRSNKHIIICIDHRATEGMRIYRDQLIKKQVWNDITIQYIFPPFHMVSSMMEEYIHEEARFDFESIVSYIGDSLPEPIQWWSLQVDL